MKVGTAPRCHSRSVRLLANQSNTKMEQDAVQGDRLGPTSSSKVPLLKDSVMNYRPSIQEQEPVEGMSHPNRNHGHVQPHHDT